MIRYPKEVQCHKMSYLEPPPAQHVILLDKISCALTKEDIPRFKNRCLAEGVRPGEIERYSALELLQVLGRRRVLAPGKYTKLVEILEDINRSDLVQELFPLESREKAFPAPCRSEADRNSQCRRTPAGMNTVVSEKHLSWLASKMGEEWEQVGIQCLGFSKNEIFHCKADGFTIQNKIYNMLYKWKCRLGKEATYSKLTASLAAFEDFDKTILDEMKQMISSGEATAEEPMSTSGP